MSQIAIYVRQSQDKTGQETAVERQETACRALAAAKGWTDVLAVYRDNDRSATTGKTRPEFERLVRDVEAGRVAAILVWHIDRLTRSIRDLQRVIEAGQARGVNIASVHGVSIDLGDPTGIATATILTAVAAMEVAHKGERQRAANRQRADAGKAHWVRRPFGYQRDGDAVTTVPVEANALRDAAERVLAGETLASVCRHMNAGGLRSTVGKPWNVTSLRRALINPRTVGRRLYNGEDLGAGVWDPILDDETHHALEVKLNDPRRRTAPDDLAAKFLLSGIASCGKCGRPMFASPYKAKGREYMTYRCFGGYCLSRRLDAVDEVVTAVVTGLLARPDASRLFTSGEEAAALRQRALDLRDRRDALAAMLADGLLSASAVREQAGKLSRELLSAEDSLASAEGVSPAAAVVGAADVAAAWEALPLPAKRKIIRQLMTVTILPAGKGSRFSPEHVRCEPKVMAR